MHNIGACYQKLFKLSHLYRVFVIFMYDTDWLACIYTFITQVYFQTTFFYPLNKLYKLKTSKKAMHEHIKCFYLWDSLTNNNFINFFELYVKHFVPINCKCISPTTKLTNNHEFDDVKSLCFSTKI